MLPNLKQLASEGTIVAMDMVRFTDTKAGWAQILTGYVPEVMGVYSNERYKPIPKGYTIFERLENRFGPDNIATVAVIGKKKHVDADPPVFKKLGRRALQKLKAKEARLFQKELIVEDPPLLPDVVTKDGQSYIKTPGKPYYITKDSMDAFVHFAEIDHKGHRYGEDSKEQRGAYRSADKWTGKIMDKLKELGLYEDTLIYVTSDHGFMKVGRRHWDAPYVFLATNDAGVMRRGDRVDVTPTILDRYGFDLAAIEPPLDGHSLLKPHEPPIW
jgi:phosphoglycerol transferase MdoB-like AlkP superfamily enzyme